MKKLKTLKDIDWVVTYWEDGHSTVTDKDMKYNENGDEISEKDWLLNGNIPSYDGHSFPLEEHKVYIGDLRSAAREWIKELDKINYCPKCGKYSKEYCGDEYAHFCSNEGCNDNVWYGDGEIEKIEWIKHFFNLEDK